MVREVQEAAFQIKKGKAPGDDGINIELFETMGINLGRLLSPGDTRQRTLSPAAGRSRKPFSRTKSRIKKNTKLSLDLLAP